MAVGSKEAVIDSLNKVNHGNIPIMPPFQGTWAIHQMGMSPTEAIEDPVSHAKLQAKVAKVCGFDAIEGMWDWLTMVEAIGCQTEFRPGMGAVTVSHILVDEPDLIPDIIPEDDYRAVSNAKTIGALLDEDLFVYATVPGVFTLSAESRGLEQLMMDSLLEEDAYRSILTGMRAILQDYCTFYDDVAEGIMLCESTGTPLLVDPESLRKDVVPLNNDLLQRVQGYTLIHNCGDVTQLEPDFPPPGIDLLSIHEDLPMDGAMDRFDCCVSGGISSTSSLLKDGTEATLKDISRSIVEIEGQEHRFILGASCDIAPSTPMENVIIWQYQLNKSV